MKILRMLRNVAQRSYYSWQLRHVNPMAPFVGELRMSQLRLEDEWRQLCR